MTEPDEQFKLDYYRPPFIGRTIETEEVTDATDHPLR
jgi:hypothetical protein